MEADNITSKPAQADGINSPTIAQRLLTFIHGLDSEFPLSGGESDAEFANNASGIAHGIAKRAKGIDANFPLSGV